METDFETLKIMFESKDFDVDCSPDEANIIVYDDVVFYFSPLGELQDIDSDVMKKGYEREELDD